MNEAEGKWLVSFIRAMRNGGHGYSRTFYSESEEELAFEEQIGGRRICVSIGELGGEVVIAGDGRPAVCEWEVTGERAAEMWGDFIREETWPASIPRSREESDR
jgi:hypothetical protein